MQANEVIWLSFANASVAFTITETKLFRRCREWVKERSRWAGELVSCGYCLGHWSGFALTLIYRPQVFRHSWSPLSLALTAIAIAWLSAFQWIVLCWLMQKVGK